MAEEALNARASLDNAAFNAGVAGMQNKVTSFQRAATLAFQGTVNAAKAMDKSVGSGLLGSLGAGRAYVNTLRAGVTGGLDNASKKLRSFGRDVTMVGAAISASGAAMSAPFLASAKLFADAGSEIYDLSQRTGMAAESLSILRYAAQQSGATLENVEIAVKTMQKQIAATGQNTQDAAKAMEYLTLSYNDLKNLTPDQQFRAVSEAVAAIQDPATRAAAAVKYFGRSGTVLLPMINDMKALEAEARKIGAVMTDETAASADALGDSWSRMSAALKQTSMALGQAVAPTLQSIIDKITQAAVAASAWIKENQQLVVGAAAAAAGLAGLGVILTGLGGAIVAASFGMTVLSGAFSLGAGLVAALMTPFGALAAVVVGIGIYLADVGGLASAAFAKVEDAARSVLKTVTGAGEGIRAALDVGDLPAAVDMAWSAIKIIYHKGVNALENAWDGVKSAVSEFFSWFRVKLLEGFRALADAVYTMFQHTGLEFVIGDQLEKGKERSRRFYTDEIDSENQSMADSRQRMARQKQQRDDALADEQARLDGDIAAMKQRAEKKKQDEVYDALEAALNRKSEINGPNQEQINEAEKAAMAEKKKQAQDELERLYEQKSSNQQDIENARRNIESIQTAFESTGSFGGAGLASFVGANSQSGIEQNTQVIADRMDKNNKLLRDIADNTAIAYQFT